MDALLVNEINRLFKKYPETNKLFLVGDTNLFIKEQFAIDHSRSSGNPVKSILRTDKLVTDPVKEKPKEEKPKGEFRPVATPEPSKAGVIINYEAGTMKRVPLPEVDTTLKNSRKTSKKKRPRKTQSKK